MQLSKTDIEEFKTLYEAEFDEQIEWSEAERMARDVMNLFEALYESSCRQLNTSPPSDAQAHKAPTTAVMD